MHIFEVITLGIQSQHGLNGDVDTLKLVLLKHSLNHLLTVLVRVHRGLSEKDLALTRVDLEFLVEGIVPHIHDILPVTDDTIVQRIGDLEHGAELGGFITHHDILIMMVLAHHA